MNAGMILMICGGAFTVIGLIMAVAEAILEPKRKQNIRKRMQEKYGSVRSYRFEHHSSDKCVLDSECSIICTTKQNKTKKEQKEILRHTKILFKGGNKNVRV